LIPIDVSGAGVVKEFVSELVPTANFYVVSLTTTSAYKRYLRLDGMRLYY